MSRTKTRLVAVLAALSMLAAACGGTTTGEETSTTAAETTTTTAAETTTTEAMADDSEEMSDDEMADESSDDMSEEEMDHDVPASPFAALQTAAEHVGNNGSAKALAAGVVEATGMEGSVDSPAAQTYAAFTTLLQEHVYLAGIAIDAGLSFGLDSPEFELAAETLDGNSVELADVIGSLAPEQRDAFLELWREHIGFFVDYTVGAATDDQEAKDQALADLGGYAAVAGGFFSELTGGELPASAVEESLAGHIDTVTAAIDAAAAGETTVFAELRRAAQHVGAQGSARAIVSAVVAATGMEGSVDSPAAQTYATLSALLEEHVYLAGIAVKTAYASGLDSDAFAAAAETLDQNSQDLAAVIGSVDPAQEEPFLGLWREHIGFFVDYAVGAISDDQAMIDQAKADLGGYAASAGAFFEQLSGGVIPASAVEQGLEGHIATLGGAIESLAAVMGS